MRKIDRLKSIFRTIELSLITMVALDIANNFWFWLAFGAAMIFDYWIDWEVYHE